MPKDNNTSSSVVGNRPTRRKRRLQKAEDTVATQESTLNQAHTFDELDLGEQKRQQTKISKQENAIAALTEKLQAAEAEYAAEVIKSKHVSAQNIVKNHMLAGTSLATILPVPLIDIAALTGTQLSLLRSLSNTYDVQFNEQKGKSLLTSLVSGSLPVLAIVGLSSFTKLIPGIGTLGGGLSLAVIAGAVIYATGQVFIRHFEAGGTLEDFNSKHWQMFFKQQLMEGKAFLSKKSDTTTTSATTTAETASA